MAMNLDKTITWLPPVNSNVTNFRNEFERIYGNFNELSDLHPRVGQVEDTLVLTGQTVEAGLPANTPVYFDSVANLWKRYRPNIYSNRPALFTGNDTVTLDGAVVTLTHAGNNLYINESGELATTLSSSQLTRRQSLGYRIGSDSFKLEHKQFRSRLPEARTRISEALSPNDYFGHGLAIDGDRLIVGAYGRDQGASDTGYAYIFRQNGQDWLKEDNLVALDNTANKLFGVDVDLDGDTAIIGAYEDDERGTNAGAAYIFTYDGSGWSQKQKLTAAIIKGQARFGRSVALEGDVAVVGAYAEDNLGGQDGAVYIFRNDGSTWNQEARLVSDDLGTGDLFGNRVAIYGDVVVVGAQNHDGGSFNSGAVYVFRYNSAGDTWDQEAKLIPDSLHDFMNLGLGLGIYENRIVAGAFSENNPGESASGAAYVFAYDGTNWLKEARLTASDGKADDYFGTSAVIDGETIVIGARQAGVFGSDNCGAAYVFRFNGSEWIEKEKLVSANISGGYEFGYESDVKGDLVVVGSHMEDLTASNAGAVYAFNLSDYLI